MNAVEFQKVRKVHFIGIAGVGMSALAQMMLTEGKRVTGSDNEQFPTLDPLEARGVSAVIGYSAVNIPVDVELVVYTDALAPDNPELLHARECGITTLSYFEALGEALVGKRTIAVSGTHGKTTTAAMITKVLVGAGLSPSAIVGSLLRDFGSNFVAGTSDLFVVEACEYRRHFLSLSPSILVVTNIDDDHLDYYGSLEGVTEAFGELMQKVGADGFIVCDPSDPQVKKALLGVSAKVIDYTAISTDSLSLQVPGEYNKKNAACALAVADVLGVDAEVARKALSEFTGTWRRFEFKGKTAEGVCVYDDYAHHPTEIRATLAAMRQKFPDAHVTIVFHPHLFSRTKLLLEQFAGAFEGADKVVFAPIYAAREAFDPSVSSDLLAKKVAQRGIETLSLTGFDEIVHYVRGNTPKGGIVMTMGAGDIFKVGEELIAQ